jgi:exopolysaccharide biosynthesis polyprenyl glycosylphosphotransferase
MALIKRKEPLVLVAGDILFLTVALWLTLLLRYAEPPTRELFLTHLAPFSLLFVASVAVFYIAGLYEKHTTVLQSKLATTLGMAQLANSAVAAVFFYFVPMFGLAPKTILFIYLFVSFALILFWRTYGYFALSRKAPANAIVIGAGAEMKELVAEISQNPIYNLNIVSSFDLSRAETADFSREIVSKAYSEDVSLILIDLAHENVEPVLPQLYNLIFSGITFVDLHKMYEDIFDKVPLSLLRYNWFLENISTKPRTAYDALKRLMDVSLSLLLLLASLAAYPFVWLAVKLDDGGPLFISQERIGENNKPVRILKFRTMTGNDDGRYAEGKASELAVTKAGAFLRKTRLDELPQLWNVLKGDLSLIGPRPELPALVKQYTEEIPYYNVRHIVRPGLSGWAQIYHFQHPHHKAATEETKEKLSYDLYYIKNRSFLLDLKIAARTVKTLLSIAGR